MDHSLWGLLNRKFAFLNCRSWGVERRSWRRKPSSRRRWRSSCTSGNRSSRSGKSSWWRGSSTSWSYSRSWGIPNPGLGRGNSKRVASSSSSPGDPQSVNPPVTHCPPGQYFTYANLSFKKCCYVLVELLRKIYGVNDVYWLILSLVGLLLFMERFFQDFARDSEFLMNDICFRFSTQHHSEAWSSDSES